MSDAIETQKDQLASILEALHGLSFAHDIKIFGSTAKGKECPGDIDLWVDARNIEFTQPSDLDPFAKVLRIGRQNYGLVDPFIVFSNYSFVRNDECTGWMPLRGSVKHKKEMLNSMLEDGVPLLQLDHPLIARIEDLLANPASNKIRP